MSILIIQRLWPTITMATSFGGRAAGEIIRGDDRSYDFDMILMLMESWLNMFSWTTWQLIPRPWWSVWRRKCSWTILSVMFNHILKNEWKLLFMIDCMHWGANYSKLWHFAETLFWRVVNHFCSAGDGILKYYFFNKTTKEKYIFILMYIKV